MTPETTFIYALCEPGTRTVRYIGKTIHLKRRFREHLKDSIKNISHFGNWLRLLKSRNQKPDMIVLREVPTETWKTAEERYIRLARGLGMNLTNTSDGGQGCTGYKHSPEAVEKIRSSMNRRDLTGVNNPWFGGKHSPETRAEYSHTRKGKRFPPEFGAAISSRMTGEGNHRFGKKDTEETISKKRLAQLGKRATEEKLKKMRGRVVSDETRKRQSEAAKLREARKRVK